MKYILYMIALVGVISSCTVNQHIHFNEDWSGKVTLDVDASQMMAFAAEMETDTTSDAAKEGAMDGMDEAMEEAVKELNAIEGISNARAESNDERGTIRLVYDFADVKAFNASMSDMEGDMMKGALDSKEHERVTVKGNKVIFSMPPPPEDAAESAGGMDESMAQMLQYNLTLSFDKGVKKVKTKSGAKEGSDGHSVVLKTTMTEILDPEFNSEIQIVLSK